MTIMRESENQSSKCISKKIKSKNNTYLTSRVVFLSL